MRIEAGQHLRMDQRMKLAPRMIQSMEILQMPAMALEERIEQELASNPTLELRELDEDQQQIDEQRDQTQRDDSEGERELVAGEVGKDADSADDFERLSNLSEEYGDAWEANTYETGESYRRVRDSGERDKKLDAMANTAARPACLMDQLLMQWRLVEPPADSPESTMSAGEYLIGLLDADGYLRLPREQVISQRPIEVCEQAIDAALQLIQTTLEPVGIGARDLRECLLLQIDARMQREAELRNGSSHRGEADPLDPAWDDRALERLLVSDYLKDIEANRLPRIARQTGLDIERIKAGIFSLRQYYPHPGRLLADTVPQTIQPDAIIEYDEQQDRYVATLTNGHQPGLMISSRYKKMARDSKVDGRTREFVRGNLRSAQWLLDAINQRNHTLLRVINVVTDAQRDFFDQGPQALKPLPMTQVADQLDIHVATVSRAVNEKYVQSPRGIYPLRMFFSGGTETQSGDAMSWAAVQARLKEIIDNEDKQAPLNDDQLVEKLKAVGIDIARRTVAKYRKQLNIPPARQRREF